MTLARRWKIVALVGGVGIAVLVASAIPAGSWCRMRECTYYGAHSNLLRVGERIVLSEDFTSGDHVVAKAQTGIVHEEAAWDEDSCDPDRPVKVALTSGEVISLPLMRYIVSKSTNPYVRCQGLRASVVEGVVSA
jgi:hypothetical protein